MSDLVGNPEDRFSHNEAQLSEPDVRLRFQDQCFTGIQYVRCKLVDTSVYKCSCEAEDYVLFNKAVYMWNEHEMKFENDDTLFLNYFI